MYPAVCTALSLLLLHRYICVHHPICTVEPEAAKALCAKLVEERAAEPGLQPEQLYISTSRYTSTW